MSQETEMHSISKQEDPFNFSHSIVVHARTLQVKDLIYVLNLDQVSS